MKYVLGTAGIGLPNYGLKIADPNFNPHKFLMEALDQGVNKIDTANVYGNAEDIISFALQKKNCLSQIKVSTKISNINIELKNDQIQYNIYKEVEDSINRLRVPVIDILYLHQNETSVFTNKIVIDSLCKLRGDGFINKIGLSLYSHEEINRAIGINVYDVIQVPVNVLDASYYNLLKKSNSCEIIARSIFLQGALDLRNDGGKKYNKLNLLKNKIQRIERLGADFKMALNEVCYKYVCAKEDINHVIVGTRTIENVQSCLKWDNEDFPKDLELAIDEISKEHKSWTNPRRW